MYIWIWTMVLGGAVFVPLLVISLVRLESTRLAFVLSATFTIGAMIGFFLSMLLAYGLRLDTAWNGIALFLFASAGAIGGAALALALLRRFGRRQ
jgi:hypothetical protein